MSKGPKKPEWKEPRDGERDQMKGFGKRGSSSFQSEGAKSQSRKATSVRGRKIGSVQRAAQQRQQKRRDER